MSYIGKALVCRQYSVLKKYEIYDGTVVCFDLLKIHKINTDNINNIYTHLKHIFSTYYSLIAYEQNQQQQHISQFKYT